MRIALTERTPNYFCSRLTGESEYLCFDLIPEYGFDQLVCCACDRYTSQNLTLACTQPKEL